MMDTQQQLVVVSIPMRRRIRFVRKPTSADRTGDSSRLGSHEIHARANFLSILYVSKSRARFKFAKLVK